MAQKVQILLVDDIDGSDATQTVAFGLDGANYEIDLNDDHAAELREALALYLGNARRLSGRRSGGTRARAAAKPATTSGASAKEIREWARESGYDVPDRGRIPTEIREAYEAAH